jgi:hypothetical protein
MTPDKLAIIEKIEEIAEQVDTLFEQKIAKLNEDEE